MHRSEVSRHTRSLLWDDEEVLWTSKPQKRAHYASTLLGSLFVLVFLGIFFSVAVTALFVTLMILIDPGGSAVPVASGVGLLLVLGIVGGTWLAVRKRYDNAEFSITDERAIATSGLVGRDTHTARLADVRDVVLSIGLLDKVFGTGRILLRTAEDGGGGPEFHYIEDPYKVLDTIEDLRRRAGDTRETAREPAQGQPR